MQLLDHWFDNTLISNSTNVRYNDCWGYTQDGIEYALAGSTEGLHIFSISENEQLIHIDSITGNFVSTMVVHRDIKTFKNYAYTVCDEGQSSLQIVDLSYLPDSVHLVSNDTLIKRIHNLYIDEENELMYACTVTSHTGATNSMIVYTLADPENPAPIYEGPSDIPEVHDAYVKNNIAYLNCGLDGIRVYDFSTPTAPIFLQNLSLYQDQGYNHQGWLSPDGTKYVFGDETTGKRLKLCSVDASHNLTIEKKFGTNYEDGSIAHNIVISDNFAYVAYYNEGLRIFDLRTPIPSEVAYYDTYPNYEPLFKMQGAWGIFTDFPSGRLLVSDRHTGLYLLDFNETIFDVTSPNEADIYPNPVSRNDFLTIKFNVEKFDNLEVALYNTMGQLITQQKINDQSYETIKISSAPGIYVLKISYIDYLGRAIDIQKKLVVD
ncbi:choice-of-anchor B family protein [Crocinitomicaceae bacterium]|nr:choice-of-anchor B family protein [Crocinitomicaceae bacterium]